MAVTLKDVAREAGVSACTVSRVLNGRDRGKVSPQKAAEIRDLARRLGYKPNMMARGLVMNRTNLIGLVVPDVLEILTADILQEIQDYVSDKGYSVLLYTSHGRQDLEAKYLQLLAERGIDGVLWMPCSDESVTMARRVSQVAPVVQMFNLIEELDLPYVVLDHELGGYIATEHLLSVGKRRILHLSYSKDFFGTQRRSGFERAVHNYSIDDPDLVGWAVEVDGPGWQCGYNAMKAMVDSGQALPDGMFAYSDLVAWGAVVALLEKGIRIPEDVAVVGFDNISICPFMEVPLTTVAQPYRKMATMAAEMLDAQIQGKKVRSMILPPELVVRASTVASSRRF